MLISYVQGAIGPLVYCVPTSHTFEEIYMKYVALSQQHFYMTFVYTYTSNQFTKLPCFQFSS